MLYGKINFSIWNKIYRKKLWENVRFPIELTCGEDAYFSFKTFEICKTLYVLDQPLYFYRLRSNSAHTIAYKTICSQIPFSLFIIEFVKNHIPEFFTAEDLRKSRQLYFDNIVIFFAYYSDTFDKEGRERRKDLRKKIIETGKQIGIENCGTRTKIAYWIFLKFPYLLKPIYLFLWPLFQKMKNFVKKRG